MALYATEETIFFKYFLFCVFGVGRAAPGLWRSEDNWGGGVIYLFRLFCGP